MPKRDPATLFTAAPLPVCALSDSERLACLRLIRSAQVGPVTFRELINHFGGAAEALKALPTMARRSGRPLRLCPEADAEAELGAAQRAGATLLFTIEPGYPAALAAVDAPPPMLYIKGRAELLARPAVAIVGSRNASAAGLKISRMFGNELSDAGFVIVSGLARGIDAAAHEASLRGGTVAVLAGGTDIVLPARACARCMRPHRRDWMPCRRNSLRASCRVERIFPRRNRLISGLSLGVVVVEAARRSRNARHREICRRARPRGIRALLGHPLDPRAEGRTSSSKPARRSSREPPRRSGRAGGATDATEKFAGAPARATRESDCLRPRGVARDVRQERGDRVLAALGPHPIDIDELARATALGARDEACSFDGVGSCGERSRATDFNLCSRGAEQVLSKTVVGALLGQERLRQLPAA